VLLSKRKGPCQGKHSVAVADERAELEAKGGEK
jgi:hypothetical protein